MSTVHGARLRAREFHGMLRCLGYDLFTGVPCSLLSAVYPVLEESRTAYYPATREDMALGIAAGAALAGARPAVLIQNSGLGLIVTALLSLQSMYELPLLMVLAWRGHGVDAPEHVPMGARMVPLLDLLEVPHRLAFSPEAADADFHRTRGPIALLVRPGELEDD